MHQFKDFNIDPSTKTLTGKKIEINRILNREIIVHEYRIENSKYEKGNGKCLHLQISLEDCKHVIFTGSGILMEMIERIPKDKFPFKTIIVRENEGFRFT